MSPNTAEIAIGQAAPEAQAAGVGPAAAAQGGAAGRHAPLAQAKRWLAALRADPARMAAIRDTWRALWLSRLLVLVAGLGTVATLGFGPRRGAFDPPGVTRGFGSLGDLLAAPVARWDSAWYLVIAHYGYRPELSAYGTAPRDAFFPLYPLGLRLLSDLGLQPVFAGVLFSLAAFALALYFIHRLTALELGARWRLDAVPATGAAPAANAAGTSRVLGGAKAVDGVSVAGSEAARLAVFLTAFAPMAFFFSAVYSESLYLALSVGLFWCARQGRWLRVGLLGALAAATRSTGVVLLAPALMLYLYGPREDAAPMSSSAVPRARSARARHRSNSNREGPRGAWPSPAREGIWASRTHLRGLAGRLRPRYRLRPDIFWLALVPAGLGAYMAYLGLAGGDPLAPFHAQEVWGRHFAGPYLAVWDGVKAAVAGAQQLLSAQTAHLYYPVAAGSSFIAAGHNLMLLAFLLAAIPLVVLVLRSLPLAYGVYVLLALALPLSYPVAPQPLMSLPRFLLVLFPLSIAFAGWLAPRPRLRLRVPVLIASALLMAFFSAQFATWHWVA
ncbi:MAG TPA: hypothetical protein VMG80_00915 [Solirubrobacteraceae bacterium]|nr:hypothetical protein [Solirubrobacteraceae bacterium]